MGDGIMPGKKSERIKTYIVLALVIIATSVAYFNFFYKKGSSVPSISAPGLAGAPVTDLKVPKIDTYILKKKPTKEIVVDEFRGTDIRDLFSHLKMLTKIAPEETGKAAEILKLSFTLKGTLLDGENQIAIINGKFLRMGEEISGYEVVKISNNEVLLNSGDHEIFLEVIRAVLK